MLLSYVLQGNYCRHNVGYWTGQQYIGVGPGMLWPVHRKQDFFKYMHAHSHACTHTHACTHMCTHECMHIHTYTHSLSLTHTHAHTLTHTHTHTHTYTEFSATVGTVSVLTDEQHSSAEF